MLDFILPKLLFDLFSEPYDLIDFESEQSASIFHFTLGFASNVRIQSFATFNYIFSSLSDFSYLLSFSFRMFNCRFKYSNSYYSSFEYSGNAFICLYLTSQVNFKLSVVS